MTGRRKNTSTSLSLWEILASLAAPPAWAFTRYLLFGEAEIGAWTQITHSLWGSSENLTLSLFLVGCASFSFWTLGAYGSSWREEADQRQEAIRKLEEDLDRRGLELDELGEDLTHRMKQFHRTNARLQKSLDRKEVMQLAADSLKEILGYDRVNLLLLSQTGQTLEFMASRGTGDDNVAGVTLPMDERAGILYLTLRRNEPILVRDIRDMPAEYHLQPPCDGIPQLRSRSFIVCPITINAQPVGLFGVDNKQNRRALNDSDLDTVRIFAEQVAAALSKIDLLQAVELLTAEIQRTFEESLRHRQEFARLVDEVKRDTRSSSDSVGQLRGSSENLYQAVDDTGSATSEISAAVHQVSQNLERLDELMAASIEATREISAAARQTNDHAVSSRRMAETVRQEAQEGVALVSSTHQGLLKIAEAMGATVTAFDQLAERTENIGGFLTLIKEINQKTQLLSLNASILAAQAGEHGRAFAVVAQEINSLYEETSGSAQAIEELLDQVHQQTRVATREISRTRSLIDEGVAVGRNTEQTLHKISTSAEQALHFAGNIQGASQEQTSNAEHTAKSIQEMGEIGTLVSSASREQAEAIGRIARQVEDIEGMAETLSLAAGQQEQRAGHIDAMMDQVQVMGLQIFSEIEKRRDESSLVIEQLNQLKGQPKRGADPARPAPPALHRSGSGASAATATRADERLRRAP